MRIIEAVAVSAAIFGSAAAVAVAGATSNGGSTPAAAESYEMSMPVSHNAADVALLAGQPARARVATAKYVNDLAAAKADGYSILTQKIPGVGYHFINPKVRGFNVTRQAILGYDGTGAAGSSGHSSGYSPRSL